MTIPPSLDFLTIKFRPSDQLDDKSFLSSLLFSHTDLLQVVNKVSERQTLIAMQKLLAQVQEFIRVTEEKPQVSIRGIHSPPPLPPHCICPPLLN